MDNARTFGAQAQTYASARPHYPPELYDWIASQSVSYTHLTLPTILLV